MVLRRKLGASEMCFLLLAEGSVSSFPPVGTHNPSVYKGGPRTSAILRNLPGVNAHTQGEDHEDRSLSADQSGSYKDFILDPALLHNGIELAFKFNMALRVASVPISRREVHYCRSMYFYARVCV